MTGRERVDDSSDLSPDRSEHGGGDPLKGADHTAEAAGIIQLDPATVFLEPEFKSRADEIVRPHLRCSVPQYFFRTWVGSGDLLPEQVVAWLYLTWAVCAAQWASSSSLITRVALPLSDLGRVIGARSPNTVRRKIVDPIRAGEAISLFIRGAAAIDPRAYGGIARFEEGRQVGLPRNPGTLFTVSMTVPVHPRDVDDRFIAEAPENRTVRWILARDQPARPDPEPSVPELSERAPEAIRWADNALDWAGLLSSSGELRDFEAGVLRPLLSRLGESDPGSVIERFRPAMADAMGRLGWTRVIEVTRRVAGNLEGKRYPLSYLRTALEREPGIRGGTASHQSIRPPSAQPRSTDPEKVALFQQELAAFRARKHT